MKIVVNVSRKYSSGFFFFFFDSIVPLSKIRLTSGGRLLYFKCLYLLTLKMATVKQEIEVLGLMVQIKKIEDKDFVSLTDIAKRKNTIAPKNVVANWLRLRNTVDFLWLWETINNSNFNSTEFDAFKSNLPTYLPHRFQ